MVNIIMDGAFNFQLNPTVDKRGGNFFQRQSVIIKIEELYNQKRIYITFGALKTVRHVVIHAWSQSEPQIFSRLDYWL